MNDPIKSRQVPLKLCEVAHLFACFAQSMGHHCRQVTNPTARGETFVRVWMADSQSKPPEMEE